MDRHANPIRAPLGRHEMRSARPFRMSDVNLVDASKPRQPC